MVELLLILIAKVTEVSLSTIRTVLVNKGEKLYVACIGFIEVLIWLKVVSVVLVGISENPSKMFVYALGYSIGCLLGITLEEKMALGLVSMQIISNKDDEYKVVETLKSENKAVIITEGHGINGDMRSIITTHISRKDRQQILDKLSKLDGQLVITVSEAKKVYGGYGIKR